MRNRPDSRRRLAGLRPEAVLPDEPVRMPVLPPAALPAGQPAALGGWTPDDDELDPGPQYGLIRRLPRAHRSSSERRHHPDTFAGPHRARPEWHGSAAAQAEPGAVESRPRQGAPQHAQPEPEPEPKPDGSPSRHPVPDEADLDLPDPAAPQPWYRPRRERRSAHHPWGRLARRWVPEPLRDSRIDPGKRGALLLALVAAVAAVIAAVGVWRDRPEPRPVQSISLAQVTDSGIPVSGLQAVATAATGRRALSGGSSTAIPTAGSARSLTAATAAADPITVSVTGAVRRPGLIRLPAGARVADALDKAGGVLVAADLTGLNLAAKLSDGASVVVADTAGASTRPGSSVSGNEQTGGATTAVAGKLDLNTADVAGLDALPGVGPVTAASIVAWREKNGHFTSVAQLQEIQGIGPAKFAALAQLVKV